jgi:hypothetical protein
MMQCVRQISYFHVSLYLDCWQQCDSRVAKADATWWYTSVKNKSKLHRRRDLRREHRQNIMKKKAAISAVNMDVVEEDDKDLASS